YDFPMHHDYNCNVLSASTGIIQPLLDKLNFAAAAAEGKEVARDDQASVSDIYRTVYLPQAESGHRDRTAARVRHDRALDLQYILPSIGAARTGGASL